VTEKIIGGIERAKKLIAKGREFIAGARKAAIPAMAALGLIVGTDSPIYIKAGAVLVALGVYWIPNAKA
jgi:mannitol-specific phosphotransferase system IIBC component